VLLTIVLAAGCLPRAAQPVAPRPGATTPTYVYLATSGGDLQGFLLDGGHLMARGISGGRGTVALAAGRGGRFLYAATGAGEVTAYTIRPTGALAALGRGSARGAGTAALSVHRGGKYLLAANGGSGTAAVLPIKPDGSLARAEVYPTSPVPHAIAGHPSTEIVFVADGRHSRITQFVFNTGTGILTPSREPPLDLPAQSGPRRIAFHPGGRFVYVMEEGAGVIAGYNFEPISGTLAGLAFQTITLAEAGPAPAAGSVRRRARPPAASGDLQVAPSGRFLYAVDGAHDVVSIFSIDQESGGLAVVARVESHGRRPSALTLADRGRVLLVAHQGTPAVASFFTDQGGGGLVHAADTPLRGPAVCLVAVTPAQDL
jgi:6-phosphogluconolactonase